MSYVVSWSGGKDSCFACYKAIQEGYKVTHLLNIISKETKMVNSHGIQDKLIKMQAMSIGLPLIQTKIKKNYYEQGLKKAVQSLIPNGIKGIIFGDIYVKEYKIQKHQIWAEKICAELEIEAIEPLWGLDPKKTLLEMIDLGFEAIIVSSKANLIGKEWIGRKVDKEFLNYLKVNNINIFGEKGEYHTFVTDCPLFNNKIVINKCRPIMKNGYWFLDILECSKKNNILNDK